MKRLWKSLAQRIGAQVSRHFRSYEDADFAGQIESLQRLHRIFSERNQMEEFWNRVGHALMTQRRIGTHEGSSIAKRVLKPFVKVVEAIDDSESYWIHTNDPQRASIAVMDVKPVRAAIAAAMEAK